MTAKRMFLLLPMLLSIIATAVLGISVDTNYDTVRMTSCTRATIYAYADNPSARDYGLAISVNSGKLMASVETPIQSLSAYGTRGTDIQFYSNQCFKGNEDVVIYYQTCDTNSNCTVAKKTVRVNVEPCVGCTSYIEQYLPTSPNWDPAREICIGTGCGQQLVSDLYFEDYYVPTSYSAEIVLPSESYSLNGGATLEVAAIVKNTGSQATIDLVLGGYTDELGATIPRDSVGLEKGEAKTVPITMNLASDRTGEYCVYLAALRAGIELDRKYVCVKVYDSTEAAASAPQTVTSPGCFEATYEISIENLGAMENTYSLSTDSAAAKVSPASLFVDAGDTRTTTVRVDTSKISQEQAINVRISGERTNEISGKQFSAFVRTIVKVTPCLSNTTVEAESGSLLSISEIVGNPTGATLSKVMLSVEGLPTGYIVMQKEPVGVDIAPGESANLTVYVQAPKDATSANGMLVARDKDGRIISQRPVVVSSLGSSAGITGFFTKAVGGNALGIVLVLILAVVVVVAYKNQEKTKAAKGTAKTEAKETVQLSLSKEGAGDSATVTK